MTREKEIQFAAAEYSSVVGENRGFKAGATWADENPKDDWIEADKQLPQVAKNMGASRVVIILCDDGAMPSYAQYFERPYQKGWYYLSGKKVSLNTKVVYWRNIHWNSIPSVEPKGGT